MAAKAGRIDDAIFKLFSNGYYTGRDAYIYNFSRDACAENARKMVNNYLEAHTGDGTNSRMDHPRTRSFTRSQAATPQTFDGIETLKNRPKVG